MKNEQKQQTADDILMTKSIRDCRFNWEKLSKGQDNQDSVKEEQDEADQARSAGADLSAECSENAYRIGDTAIQREERHGSGPGACESQLHDASKMNLKMLMLGVEHEFPILLIGGAQVEIW